MIFMLFYVLSYFFAESFLSENIWRFPLYDWGLLINFVYFLSWIIYYVFIFWILIYLFIYYPVDVSRKNQHSIDFWFFSIFRSLLSLPISLYLTFIFYFIVTYFLYVQEICNRKISICMYAVDSTSVWFLVLWAYVLVILPISIFLYCLLYALILFFFKKR